MAEELQVADSVVSFASTSKITYAGSGIGFMALSKSNMEIFMKYYSAMVICPDKVNQARHVRFFDQNDGVDSHMKKHADILRPKFELVEKKLSEQGYGSWTKPTGGYFVSFTAGEGLAKEIISLSRELGLELTSAGAAYPYGIDPLDENIRIAPTACSLDDLEKAMDVFVTCVALATLRNGTN